MRSGDDTIETVDIQGTQNLIDAAKAAGVRHFIYTSAAEVYIGHPNPLYNAKATCEAYLKESGLTYTLLKPGIFMEVWIGAVVGIPLQAGQPVTLVGRGDHKHAFVSVQDVAAYAVAAVDNLTAYNQAIEINGPTSCSWTEIVEAVGEAMGQQLPINYVPMGKPIPLIPEIMVPLLNAFETYEDYIDMRETAAIYGVEPTPVSTFAKSFFALPTA
jgi:NADH dehydrogenase